MFQSSDPTKALTESTFANSGAFLRHPLHPERLLQDLRAASIPATEVKASLPTSTATNSGAIAGRRFDEPMADRVAFEPTATRVAAVGILPTYESVVTRRTIPLSISDWDRNDGDVVTVKFNGQTLTPPAGLAISSIPVTYNVNLLPGTNFVEVQALNAGVDPLNTPRVSVPGSDTIYGVAEKQAGLAPGGSFLFTLGLPLIQIDGSRFPEAAQHILDAQPAPRILTIDRPGAPARRRQNVARYNNLVKQGLAPEVLPGQERDEAPPAVFLENGGNASVRAISASDNSGAGGSLGRQINDYGPSNITLPDGSNVDFWATPPGVAPTQPPVPVPV